MTNLARYTEALFQDPVWVFGVKLQPLCIGNALLLHRVDSPFVSPDEDRESEMGDLLLALYICSRPYNVVAAGLGTRRMRWLLRAWAWKVRKFATDMQVAVAQSQFEGYLVQAWDGPTVWEEAVEQPRTTGAPFLSMLKVSLRSVFGTPEHEALATPIRQALEDLTIYGEIQARLEIVSDEQAKDIGGAE